MHTGRTPSAQGNGDANHHKTAARAATATAGLGETILLQRTQCRPRGARLFIWLSVVGSLRLQLCGLLCAVPGERPGKASRDGDMILVENLHTKQLAGKGADKFLPPFCLHRVGSVRFFFFPVCSLCSFYLQRGHWVHFVVQDL